MLFVVCSHLVTGFSAASLLVDGLGTKPDVLFFLTIDLSNIFFLIQFYLCQINVT